MTSKPSTRDGYDRAWTARVRTTCLYIATKLGDLLDEIVVVGGLVPYLLVELGDPPAGADYPGTMDLDMGLALGILSEERYRELGARLRAAGFKPDVNDQGNARSQTWTSPGPYPVKVDFLIPPPDEMATGGTVVHIERDLAAFVTPGLELAFEDRRLRELAGRVPSGAWASRTISVCGPGAFTVLQALAFGNRTENKDAYDLFYVWRGIGVDDVATSLASLEPSSDVDDALSVIERDFLNHDGPGPVATAQFLGGLDDNVQADVVGYADALLRSLGRS